MRERVNSFLYKQILNQPFSFIFKWNSYYTHHRLCTDISHLEQVNRKLYKLMETSVDGYTLRDIDSKVQVSSASKNRFLDFFLSTITSLHYHLNFFLNAYKRCLGQSFTSNHNLASVHLCRKLDIGTSSIC